MVWWQIVLIILGFIVVGASAGILLSYFINRFMKERFIKVHKAISLAGEQRHTESPVIEDEEHERAPMAKEQPHEIPSAGNNQSHKDALRMVPLLSRRSIIILTIGLVVGIGLGLGYWAVSPINPEIKLGWPPIEFANKQATLYESTVYIQVVNRGASFMPAETLRRQTDYYGAKMNTLPFFQFLNEKLAQQAPRYSHTPSELANMIKIDVTYDNIAASIRVKVTSQGQEEASLIASIVGPAFPEYLNTEQRNLQLEALQSKLGEIASVRTALLEAEKELGKVILNEGYDLTVDPSYIALNAKIDALERELGIRASALATLISKDGADPDYPEGVKEIELAIERTSTALGEARRNLSSLSTQSAVNYFEERTAYIEANTKVGGLSKQLSDLVAGLLSTNTGNLEEMQTFGFTAGNPTASTLVPPEKIRGRSAMIIGAMFGLGVAWVGLNRKWLAKGVPSSPEEDEVEDKV